MLIPEASQQTIKVLRKLKTLCLKAAMNHHDRLLSLACSSSVRKDLKQNLGNSGREEKLKFLPDCEQLM